MFVTNIYTEELALCSSAIFLLGCVHCSLATTQILQANMLEERATVQSTQKELLYQFQLFEIYQHYL